MASSPSVTPAVAVPRSHASGDTIGISQTERRITADGLIAIRGAAVLVAKEKPRRARIA